MTIGNRIKQRRLSLGYTLDELRDRISSEGHNISKAALSKYELDKSVPKATNLWHIAKALNASPDYFLRVSTFEIKWVAFRKKSTLTKKEEDILRARAKEHIEAQLFFTEILENEKIEPDLNKIAIGKIEEAETAAKSIRERWNLNNWPIESITSLLEKKGIFIIELGGIGRFDGLSGFADNSLPVIITSENIPIDRKRLNIAHELAHLLFDVKDVNEEQAAFRFAAAFLMPEDCLKRIIGNKRKNIDLRELVLLKEEYGISVQALIRRCYDLAIISHSMYKTMNIVLRSQGLHLDEPGTCFHKETPTLMESKLIRAIAEGNTTQSDVMSRFPSLSMTFDRSDSMFQDWFYMSRQEKNDTLSVAAENLKEEYGEGGSLADFEINDDIWDYDEPTEE